nr:peptidoglycan DD-metalloendopeptidase family protein [Desulfobaculum xiamenense]
MSGGTFKTRKGSLPQPVAGKRFRPDGSGGRLAAAPGRNGASYHTVNGAPVNAVFAGRVAHSDILRGFGRVVIVSHGNQYYTLYAFLSECSVSAGQDVAEGQTLGWTGPYPAAGGSGLYFELRFGQKAINPDEWLTAPR